jgi:hypothetical protein
LLARYVAYAIGFVVVWLCGVPKAMVAQAGA